MRVASCYLKTDSQRLMCVLIRWLLFGCVSLLLVCLCRFHLGVVSFELDASACFIPPVDELHSTAIEDR